MVLPGCASSEPRYMMLCQFVVLAALVLIGQLGTDAIKINASSFQLPSPPFLSGGLQTNNILLDAERVHDGKIDIPHSYVILNDDVYAATEDGLVMNVAPCSPKVIATLRPRGCLIPKECGHPISIRRSADNLLLVLDAYRGVFEIHPTTGSIRHIYDTNTVVNGRASVYLNDMVLMDDGTIIMSDPGPTFDYNNEFWIRFEGKPDGRLLGYNPVNGQVKEILSGLAYPTGLELTDDRQALLVAEAARARIIRMDLSKNKFFERSFLNINLPGMPEHIRSSGRGTYWVGLAYPRYQGEVSILDQYANRPASRNYLAMRRTEDQLKLMYTRQGLAVEVDGTGRIVANLRDPTGLKVVDVTEVVEYGGIVYVGTKAQPAVVRAVRSAAGLTVDSVIQVMRGRCQLAENQVQEAKTALQQRMRSGEVTEATRGDALYETLVPPKGGDSFFSEFSFKTEAITQTQAPASSAQGAPNAAVLKNIRHGLSQLHKTLQNAPPAQSPPAYQNRHGYQANQPGYPHPPQNNQGYRQPPQGQRPYQQQVPPYRPHNGPGSPPQQQQPPNQHTQNNMNMPPQEQADPFISNPPRSPAPLRPRPGVWNQLPSQQSYPHQPPPQPSYPHQPPPQPSYPHQPPPQPSYPHQPPPQPSYPHQPPPQPSYPHQPPPQPSYPHQPPQQESYPHQPPQQESYPQQPVQQAYNQPLNRPKDKNRPHVVHKVLNGELISHVVIGEEAATLNFKPKEKPTTTTTTTTTTPPPLPLFPDLNPNQHSPPSPGTQIHFNIPSAPSQNGGTQSGMGGSVKEQQASPQPTTKYQRQDFNLTDMEALGLGGFFGFLQESQAAESKQAQQVNPEVAIASPDQGTYKNAPSNPPSDHQMNLEQFLGSMGMQNTESLSSPQTPSTSSGAAQKPPPSNNQDILKKSAADIQNLQMLHPTGGVESLPNAKNQAVPKAELAFDEARTAFIKQGLRQLQELFRQNKPTRPPTVATDTENAPPPQSVQNANPPVRRRTFPVTTPRPPRASAQSQSVSAPDPTRAIQSSQSLGSDTSSSQSNPPSATREVSQTSPSGSGSQSQRSGQGTPTGRQVGDVQPTPPASAWTTMSGEPLTPGNAPSSQSTYSLTVGDQTSPGETSMSGAATIHPNQPSNNVFGKGSQSDEPIGLEEQFFWHDAVSPSGPSEESGQTQNTNVLPTSQPMDESQGQLSSPPNPSQQGSNGPQPSPVITPPVTPTMSTEIGETPPPQGFIQIQQGPGQYIMIPLNQATLLQALSSIPLSQIHNAKSVPVQESDVSPKQQIQQQQGPQQQLPRQTDNQQYMQQTGQSQPVPQIRDQSPQRQLPQQGLQQQQQQYPQQGQAQFPQQQQQQYPQQGQTQFPQQQQQQYPQQGQTQFPQQQQQQYPQQGQTQFPQQQQQQYPQQGQTQFPQQQQQQYSQQEQTQIPQQQQQQYPQQGQALIPQQQQQQYLQQGQTQIPQQQQQQHQQQGQAQTPQQQQQQYLQQGQSQFPQQQQQQYPQQGQAQIPQQQQQPGYPSPQPPQNLQTQSPFQPNLNPRFQHQLTQNQPVQQQLPGNVSQNTPQQTVQPSWPSQSTGQGNQWPQTETYSVQWQASTPMTEEYKPQTLSAQGNWGQQFIAQPLPSPSPPTGGNQFSTQGNIPLRSATTELSHITATSKPFTTDNFSRQTSFQPTTPPSYPVTTTQQRQPQQQFTGESSFQSSQGMTRNQQLTPTTMDMTQGNNLQFPTSLQPPTSMGVTQQFTGRNTFSTPQQQFTTENRPSHTTFSSEYQFSNPPSPQPNMSTGVTQQFPSQNTVPSTFDMNRGQQFTTGNIPPQNTFSSGNAPTSPSPMSPQPAMSSGVTQQFTRQNTFSSTNLQTQPMVPQSPQPTMPTGVTQQFPGQSTFSSTQGVNGNQQFTTVNSFPQNTFPNENKSWPPQSTIHTGTTQQFTTSENANLYSPPPTAQSVRDTTGNQFPSHMTVNPQQFTNGNTAPSIQPTSSSGIPTGTTQQFIPTNTYPTSAHTNANQYTTQGVTSPGTSSGAQQQFTTQQNWSGTSTDSRQQFTTNDGSSPTTNSFVAQPSEQPLNMSTLDIETQQNFDPNMEPSPNTSGGANESQLPPT